MSVDIKILEKRIYDNKPLDGDKANQYNFGYVLDGESLKLMGKQRSNRVNPEADLFTSVQSLDNKNLTDYPQGILNGLGSQLDITYTYLVEYDAESDGGRYRNVKIAFYAYDGDTTNGESIASAKTGKKIRSAIGQGDSFSDTTNGNRIRFLNKGDQKQDKSMKAIIDSQNGDFDSATYGSQPDNPSWTIKDMKDFPVENKSVVPFNTSIKRWTNHLTNKHSDDKSNESYIWIVGRVSGDEREYIAGFGTKRDERDREYIKLRIAKSELYSMWKNQRGETLEFKNDDYSDNYSNNSKYRGDLGSYYNGNYRDNYGNGAGHKYGFNNYDPVNMFTKLRTQITAPTFSPLSAIKEISDGGRYANWVDTTSSDGWHCIKNAYDVSGEQVGLNPKYDMDFVGFPSDFYTDASGNKSSTSGNYFDKSMIPDFRPISFVSSSFNIDLQGYYGDNTKEHEQLRVMSSIPTLVTLKFQLAKSNVNNVPEYIDLTTNTDYNNLKYYFFVVNFDWKEDEPETLEQIGDTFPLNGDEWDDLVYDGLYDRQEITSDATNGYITIPADNYLKPGIKIIKVIIFSTIDNHWESDDGGTKPYSDYVQAVHWKLATIKINLSNDGANVSSDFGDLGGDDFTYLPYPDVVNLRRTHTKTEWDSLISNSGEAGPGPPSDPENGVYKSSHPVIGGLAEESIYTTSLKKIWNTQPFNSSESDEKILFEKSYHLSPLGSNNELGNYLGQSDISQVRFFNKPYDIREMLNIETVYNDGADFYPHYDIYDEIDNPTGYWDGPENPSFPKEKVVGSIFISEYDHFKENCLVELNCGVLDGKTIKDTSGSGNKGILLGDYSIKKPKIGKPSTRDSYIKVPKTGNKDGAF